MLINRIENYLIHNSLVFEDHYSRSFRKQTGLFFTTDHSLLNILLRSIDLKTILNKRILEPSVGSGMIICNLLLKMYKHHFSVNQIVNFLQNNVYVCDLNENALNLYKQNINYLMNLFGYHRSLNLHIIHCDFTERFLFRNCFDYVIGNPPFISFYGVKGNRKSESLRDYYLTHYDFIPKRIKNGRLNSSMFFLERGIKSLKKNGILSYILDIAFLTPPYKDIRKYILKLCKIDDVYLNLQSFHVGSGQLILTITKHKAKFSHLVRIHDHVHISHIKQNLWNHSPYEFRVIPPKVLTILHKIDRKSKPLKTYFPKKSLRTNTMLLNLQDLFISKHKNYQYKFKFYQGSKSLKHPYGSLHNDYYFKYDSKLKNQVNNRIQTKLAKQGIKNKKRIGLGDLYVYTHPKLYIRQSATRIIATYSDQLDTSNNSLYSLSDRYERSGRKNDPKWATTKLLGALAQLNSDLITFYAVETNIIQHIKGRQPQIRISKLKQIPLVNNLSIMLKCSKYAGMIINHIGSKQTDMKKIEQILNNYYGLNKKDQRIIAFITYKYNLNR